MPEPSRQSPPPVQPPSPALLPAFSPSPPARALRNAERIAADRQKIADSGILDIFLDCMRGKIELSQVQVNIGFGLLKKVLPDFSTSAPPTDDEEKRDDGGGGTSPEPEFEVVIVDP
ncbi:hypothetical protein [Taklimakanibacter lacteus]|uniref:hypothetical protein n=1 Tax=Taklimakanibacter lacteus TaxID=2268456 RepID=UPI0013C4D300